MSWKKDVFKETGWFSIVKYFSSRQFVTLKNEDFRESCTRESFYLKRANFSCIWWGWVPIKYSMAITFLDNPCCCQDMSDQCWYMHVAAKICKEVGVNWHLIHFFYKKPIFWPAEPQIFANYGNLGSNWRASNQMFCATFLYFAKFC